MSGEPQARLRIAVDMDEVMADAVSENLLRYNRAFPDQLTRADLEGKGIWEVVHPSRHAAIEGFLRSEDFFAVLSVLPDAVRVMQALQQRYEVFIATAAMEVPTSFIAKYEWLGRHFPFIPASNIVFCGNKSILRADYLIDDNPRQLRLFSGQGILFHAHHNIAVSGFPRVRSWLEVESMFLGSESPPRTT
jgi:5'(3')-deoxyribonucleotidase